MSAVPCDSDAPGADSDVLVIGGGPGGSTIAALLKKKGWRVVLCEKDRHPRFHIGESLLPMNLPLFERLGVLEQVRDLGILKYGADFSSDSHPNKHQAIYFSQALDKQHSHAFQVRRSEFDHLLLKNCATSGVLVHEGVTVKDVNFRPGSTHLVCSADESGNERVWETRFVVDASGRDTLLARKLGVKRKNNEHQSAALFGHFHGVTRNAGKDAGNISIYWFKHGWFWMIPLRDDVVSVGAVCWPDYLKTRRSSIEEFMWDTIKLCPGVHERMQEATLVGPARATGNYSYQATRMYGDGYLLVGDAFAFVDPVFSTGVYLAMHSATLGVEAVDAQLKQAPSAKRLMGQFDQRVRRGLKLYSWFIYRFTSPVIHNLFMSPRNVFRMQEAIISVLAGDVFRKTPIALPLALFKAVYFVTLAANFARAWAAYRYRRRNVDAKVSFTGGGTDGESL